MNIYYMIPLMRLLTQELVDTLPKIGTESEPIRVKYFNPTGAGTWWGTEASVIEPSTEMPSLADYCKAEGIKAMELERRVRDGEIDILFFGAAEIHVFELGYFVLSELAAYRGRWGLGIERDLHWTKTALSKLAEERSR